MSGYWIRCAIEEGFWQSLHEGRNLCITIYNMDQSPEWWCSQVIWEILKCLNVIEEWLIMEGLDLMPSKYTAVLQYFREHKNTWKTNFYQGWITEWLYMIYTFWTISLIQHDKIYLCYHSSQYNNDWVTLFWPHGLGIGQYIHEWSTDFPTCIPHFLFDAAWLTLFVGEADSRVIAVPADRSFSPKLGPLNLYAPESRWIWRWKIR